ADGSQAQAGAQESAGLGAMDGFEQRGAGGLAFALQIGHLAGDHAAHGAGGGGEFGDHARLAIGGNGVYDGQDFEGQREQGVARQDGHGVAEDFVAGQLAAPIIVVIEGRKIVVDERIGMDEFQRAGGGEVGVAWLFPGGAGGFQTENGADALASGKQAIAHGAVDGLRGLRFGRRQAIEVGVDQFLLLGEVVAKVHAFSGRKGSAWILPSLRMSISTRVSASSNCLRQVSLRRMPFSKSSRERSRGRSPASSSLTTFSNSSRQASKGRTGAGGALESATQPL